MSAIGWVIYHLSHAICGVFLNMCSIAVLVERSDITSIGLISGESSAVSKRPEKNGLLSKQLVGRGWLAVGRQRGGWPSTKRRRRCMKTRDRQMLLLKGRTHLERLLRSPIERDRERARA